MATAKALFIEKGFRGTTIANIAETAGIAKGSVYSYFSSKLEIVKALVLQSSEKSQSSVEVLLEQKDEEGIVLIESYLEQEFQEVMNERSFIQLFLSEDMVLMDSEVMAAVQESRLNYHLSQQKVLLQAYGEQIEPWLFDLVSVVNGLLNEYAVYLALDEASFSLKRCAKLIAHFVDNAVQTCGKSDLEPLLTRDNFPLTQGVNPEQGQQRKAFELIESVKQEANDMSSEQKQLVMETVTLLEQQLSSEQVNTTLLRALVANLRPYPELNVYRKRLADALDIELI